MQTIEAHIAQGQVGLRGHSFDDWHALDKRFTVEVKATPGSGWNVMHSSHTVDAARDYVEHSETFYGVVSIRVRDTENDTVAATW